MFETLRPHLKAFGVQKYINTLKKNEQKKHVKPVAGINWINRLYLQRNGQGWYSYQNILGLIEIFDMLIHDILLTELKHYGFVGTPLAWFKVTSQSTCSDLSGSSGGQPLFTLGLPLCLLYLSRLPVFTVELQYQHRYFLFLSKV